MTTETVSSTIRDVLDKRAGFIQKITTYQDGIKTAEDGLAQIEIFLTAWRGIADQGEIDAVEREIGSLPSVRSQQPPSARNPRQTINNPKKEFVAEICARIIREAGKPLGRIDLYEALKERSINVRGWNPKAILINMLAEMPTIIVHLGRNKYWAADTPYPELGYHPDQSDGPQEPPTPDRPSY